MYQKEVAHAAIDAGADLILGHHPHVLKGIEVYRGKAIFYSMGNFVFDLPLSVLTSRLKSLGKAHAFNSLKPDPDYAEWYAWAPDSRNSMIVKCRVRDKHIDKVSFLPVLINTRAQPVVVSDEAEFQTALKEMQELCTCQDINTEFRTEGREIVVQVQS